MTFRGRVNLLKP